MFYKYIAPALCALAIFFGSFAIASAKGTPTPQIGETEHTDGTVLTVEFYGKALRYSTVTFTDADGQTTWFDCSAHAMMDGIIIADAEGNRLISLTYVQDNYYTYVYEGSEYGIYFDCVYQRLKL
jgi:hypothetical protein